MALRKLKNYSLGRFGIHYYLFELILLKKDELFLLIWSLLFAVIKVEVISEGCGDPIVGKRTLNAFKLSQRARTRNKRQTEDDVHQDQDQDHGDGDGDEIGQT